jgi:hypothetical protein
MAWVNSFKLIAQPDTEWTLALQGSAIDAARDGFPSTAKPFIVDSKVNPDEELPEDLFHSSHLAKSTALL